MVPQEGFLFDASLLHNIRYGKPAATRGDVEIAMTELGLADWVESLPRGLDTSVGQRGESRWAGERQLVETVRLLTQAGIRTLVLSPGESLAGAWSGLTQLRPEKGGGEWDRKPELV